MSPEISEFSFGYAFTEQYLRELPNNITAAPYFPSLYDEGKLGFDLKIDTAVGAIIIQYKVSHFMKDKRCKEYNTFKSPYFRFYLHRKSQSNQHNILVGLAQQNTVYYIAPLFHRPDELNHHYLNKSVVQNSIKVNPSFIGRIDDDEHHYVAFNNVYNSPAICSNEPRFIERTILPTELISEYLQPNFSTGAFFRNLFDTVKTISQTDNIWMQWTGRKVSRQIGSYPVKSIMDVLEQIKEDNLYKDMTYILRNYLGCELLLLFKK